MALLPILVAPHPVLKRKADPVEIFDQALGTLLDDMLETMYDAPGIGLAAPQIGRSIRALVIDIGHRNAEDPGRTPMEMINPEIIWFSAEKSSYDEGCLSVPEQFAEVIRPAVIRVEYQDRHGAHQSLEADGLLATVIQHEMDHLDGVLFIDHISNLKRNMILKKLQKAQKDAKKQ